MLTRVELLEWQLVESGLEGFGFRKVISRRENGWL
jgi:hypothetical protein